MALPLCVNPKHLWIGTTQDNTKDRDIKNRGNWLYGERHGNSKLTQDDVHNIRIFYLSGLNIKEIAAIFSISEEHAYDILNYKQRREPYEL